MKAFTIFLCFVGILYLQQIQARETLNVNNRVQYVPKEVKVSGFSPQGQAYNKKDVTSEDANKSEQGSHYYITTHEDSSSLSTRHKQQKTVVNTKSDDEEQHWNENDDRHNNDDDGEHKHHDRAGILETLLDLLLPCSTVFPLGSFTISYLPTGTIENGDALTIRFLLVIPVGLLVNDGVVYTLDHSNIRFNSAVVTFSLGTVTTVQNPQIGVSKWEVNGLGTLAVGTNLLFTVRVVIGQEIPYYVSSSLVANVKYRSYTLLIINPCEVSVTKNLPLQGNQLFLTIQPQEVPPPEGNPLTITNVLSNGECNRDLLTLRIPNGVAAFPIHIRANYSGSSLINNFSLTPLNISGNILYNSTNAFTTQTLYDPFTRNLALWNNNSFVITFDNLRNPTQTDGLYYFTIYYCLQQIFVKCGTNNILPIDEHFDVANGNSIVSNFHYYKTYQNPAIVRCSDRLPCTTGTCGQQGQCNYAPNTGANCTPQGAPFCNGTYTCDSNAMCINTPRVCGIAQSCAVGSCNTTIDSCIITPTNSLCDDNNGCTNDFCSATGICFHTPVTCPASNIPCQVNTCVSQGPSSSMCQLQNAPETQSCISSDLCSLTSQCENGTCVSTSSIVCNDQVFCNGQESCLFGICLPGIPPTCTDENACTLDVCSINSDQCTYPTDPSLGTFCIDVLSLGKCAQGTLQCLNNTITCIGGQPDLTETCGNFLDDNCNGLIDEDCPLVFPCESDVDCDSLETECVGYDCLLGVCTSSSVVGPCDDEDPCTVASICLAGNCVRADFILPSPFNNPCYTGPNVCQNDICTIDSPTSYHCNSTFNVGLPCNTGSNCLTNQQCNAQGQCTGNPVVCSDFSNCTLDFCDEETGLCVFEPLVNTTCSTGNPCLTAGVCSLLSLCIEVPIQVPIHVNPCMFYECNTLAVNVSELFIEVTIANDVPCNILGESCFQNNTCQNGQCVGDLLDCSGFQPINGIGPASPECIYFECSNNTAMCEKRFRNSSTPCDTGLPCYTNGFCSPDLQGICVGSLVDCSTTPVNEPCQTAICDPFTGFCEVADLSVECDDGDACTMMDICVEGECIGTLSNCEDQLVCNGISECLNGTCVTIDGTVPDCSIYSSDCIISTCNETLGGCWVRPLDYVGNQCGVSNVGLCRYGILVCNVTGDPECLGNIDPAPSEYCGQLLTDSNPEMCLCSELIDSNSSRCVSYGIALSYTVVAGLGIESNLFSTSVLEGNVALSPADDNDIIGFPPSIITGSIQAANSVSMYVMEDVSSSFIYGMGQVCDQVILPSLGGLTIYPGVYCMDLGAVLNDVLTLDPGNTTASEAVWIFKITGCISSFGGGNIVLSGGVSACNVHWFVSCANIGANTHLQGNIVSLGDVSLSSGTTVVGHVFTIAGTLRVDFANITLPDSCSEVCSGETICAQLSLDTDNDGVPDCQDECPTDPQRSLRGTCGCFSESVIALDQEDYCSRILISRIQFGSGNGLDENCNGIVDEGCGTGSCASSTDCLPIDCQQALCTVNNTCVYFPIGGSCPVDQNCALPAGVCVSGVCTEIPIECSYTQGLNGPWESQCVESFCTHDSGMDSCVYLPTSGGSCQVFGDLCVLNSVCDQGFCNASRIYCDDFNECTSDFCNPTSGECEYHAFSGGVCQGADLCTAVSTCLEGDCIPVTPVNCDDQNPCTVDSCLAVGNLPMCSNIPVQDQSFPCYQDSVECFPSGTCVPGLGICQLHPRECSAITQTIPQQDLACYVPFCNDTSGECELHFLEGSLCDDGNACTTNICSGGICLATMLPDPFEPFISDPHNNCTVSFCNSTTGLWSLIPQFDGVCDDGDVCTTNFCSLDGRDCLVSQTTNCDDGLYCSGQERCSSVNGTCVSGVPIECQELDGNLCTIPICSELYDACIEVLKPGIGTQCGNATLGDCNLGIQMCNATSGDLYCYGAVFPELTDPCDGRDNNCNGVVDEGCGITCLNSTQCPQVQCSDVYCSQLNICVYVANDTLTCEDEFFCSSEEHCLAGACVSTPLTNLPEYENNTCIIANCIEESDLVLYLNVSYGSGDCSDNNLCTLVDFCDGAGGCTGIAVNCNDLNQCTEDSCDPENGNCLFEPLTGANCTVNILNFVLPGVCSSQGECQPIPDPCVLNDTCPDCSVPMEARALVVNPCISGAYDPIFRICVYDPLPNGTFCVYNQDRCFNDSVCMGGQCLPNGPRRTCPQEQCLDSFCVSLTGDCQSVVTPGANCTDRKNYTHSDTCNLQGCCVGLNNTCDDQNPCTNDILDLDTGLCSFIPNDLMIPQQSACQICTCSAEESGVLSCVSRNCSNGIYCDGEEYCDDLLGCRYSPPVLCNDQNFCTTDYCSEDLDDCVYVPIDIIGTPCGIADEGECEYGVFNCSSQLGVFCYGEVNPEVQDLCDGLDRNCDGIIETQCIDEPCFSNQDCTPINPSQCIQYVCLSNSTCTRLPISCPCEPLERDPCVLSYHCTFGLCIADEEKECLIPPEYSFECVSTYCSNETGICIIELLDNQSEIPCKFHNIDGFCSEGSCDPTPLNCDDGNDCTDDYFTPESYPYCNHIPAVGRECCAGDACIINAHCTINATCQGIYRDIVPIELGGCWNDTEVCKETICVPYGNGPEDYECRTILSIEGHRCDDGRNCTRHDHCHYGQCVGVTNDCSQYDDDYMSEWDSQCIDFECLEEDGGLCQSLFINGSCSTERFCVISEECSEGMCVGGEPRQCSYDPILHAQYSEECISLECNEYSRNCDIHYIAHKNCTNTDPCNLYSECRYGRCEPVPMHCSNKNPCDGHEYCLGGECVSGPSVHCDAHSRCLVSYCEPATGDCIHDPLPQIGLPCGSNYTLGECSPGFLVCDPYSGLYCEGSVFPCIEDCGPLGLGNGLDEDCDGIVDNGCTPHCTTDSDCFNEELAEQGLVGICAQNMTCVYVYLHCNETNLLINFNVRDTRKFSRDSSSSSSSSSSSYYYLSSSSSSSSYPYYTYSTISESNDDEGRTSTTTSDSQSWFSSISNSITSLLWPSSSSSSSSTSRTTSRFDNDQHRDDDDEHWEHQQERNYLGPDYEEVPQENGFQPLVLMQIDPRNEQERWTNEHRERDGIHFSGNIQFDSTSSSSSSSHEQHHTSNHHHNDDDDEHHHHHKTKHHHDDDDDDHHHKSRTNTASMTSTTSSSSSITDTPSSTISSSPSSSNTGTSTLSSTPSPSKSCYHDPECPCPEEHTSEHDDDDHHRKHDHDYRRMIETDKIKCYNGWVEFKDTNDDDDHRRNEDDDDRKLYENNDKEHHRHHGKPYECHCKFGWEGEDCNTCAESPNSKYVYRCRKNSGLHGNAYKLTLIDADILYEYRKITRSHSEFISHHSSSKEHSSSSSSSSFETSQYINSSTTTTTTTSNTDSSDSNSGWNQDSNSGWDQDSSSSLSTGSRSSSSSSSSSRDESQFHLFDDDDEFMNYVVPGTKGLNCACESDGESNYYDSDPYARCTIEHVDSVSHSKNVHFSNAVSLAVRIIMVLVFVGFILFVVCWGLFLMMSSKKSANTGSRKPKLYYRDRK